jgi:uncharacterized protein involved in exopolysaccharide biosynthesis
MAIDNEGPRSAQGGAQEPSSRSWRQYDDDEISLLDIAIVLAKHKKLVLGLPFLAAVITASITLTMPNIYTARAVLMPPQQQESTTAAMLGQLGALASVAGSSLGIKNPNDLYVGIIRSRTIADSLIEHFNLSELYEEDTMVDTREALARNTAVISGKDGLIVIEVDDEVPERAAAMANAYVAQLEELTSRLAVTEAAQRRLFFERQLVQAKQELVAAESNLQETQERTGLVQLDQQGRAMIEAVATLRAQIVAREVQHAAMRSYATNTNPEYMRIEQELASLRLQLRKIEHGSGLGNDLLVPTKEIPAAGLDYGRAIRDVKYAETIAELMSKQYEMAKLDEARDAAVIQVVDKAVPFDKKTRPRRALIVILVASLVGVLAVFSAFLHEAYAQNKWDPEFAQRLQKLREDLTFRSFS